MSTRKVILFMSLILTAVAHATVPQTQILVNPDFNLPLVDKKPPGWFMAALPSQASNLEMYQMTGSRGSYLVMEQKDFAKNMFSNWAQRLEFPPHGKKLRLEVDVSTEDAKGGGAIVMLLFFAEDGRVVGSSTSEQGALTGTKDWTKVSLEATVPPEAHLGMVRLGLLEGPGKVKFSSARLYESGGKEPVSKPEGAGMEILVNGDFEGGDLLGTPIGWFKAMMPQKAINMKAGIENDPNRGHVVFLQQEGVHSPLINNWAQRLETVPVGARLRLSAEVKTEDVPENTGFVMIQCWGPDDKLVAAASSQRTIPIGGTRDWQVVSMEIDVPLETKTIIVRCGFSQSGKIFFDNVSLMIISEGTSSSSSTLTSKASVPRTGAFRVTDVSINQLKQMQKVAAELAATCSELLGSKSQVRHEVFAQADGQYEVVIHVKMKVEDNAGADHD